MMKNTEQSLTEGSCTVVSKWSPEVPCREATPKHFLKQKHPFFPFHEVLPHFLCKLLSSSPFPSIPSLLSTQPLLCAQLHSGTLITVPLLIQKSISPVQCSAFKAVHSGRVLRFVIALLTWIYLQSHFHCYLVLLLPFNSLTTYFCNCFWQACHCSVCRQQAPCLLTREQTIGSASQFTGEDGKCWEEWTLRLAYLMNKTF